jgi:hypothetical protein
MLHRQKLLNSENHTSEDMWACRPLLQRLDFEDALVQMVEDCLMDGKLTACRDFLRKFKWEFPPNLYELFNSQDSWAWMFVYYTGCELRRLGPRWEHCANKLKDQFGFDPKDIPQGQQFIKY